MTKITLKPYVAKSGKIIPSVSIDALLAFAGIEAPAGYAVPQNGNVILIWEPKEEMAQAKAKGIMSKPLAKLAEKPSQEGASNDGLAERLATIEKALAMLVTHNKPPSHALTAEHAILREAPVGTTITRKRKVA